jgi:hypothetical protein
MDFVSNNISCFFETYIFEPYEAGDYSKIAWISTIALGILTLGTLHLAVLVLNYARFGHYVKYKLLESTDEEIRKIERVASKIAPAPPISWEDILCSPLSEYKKKMVDLLQQSNIKKCPYEKIYLHPVLAIGPCPAFEAEGSLFKLRDEVNNLGPQNKRLILFWPQDKKSSEQYLKNLFIHYNRENELDFLDRNFLPYGHMKTWTGDIHTDLVNIIQENGNLPYLKRSKFSDLKKPID